MPKTANVLLYDRLGNRLRARMLDNGHILLSEHAHRYTYARVCNHGDVELYEDDGLYSYACLGGGAVENDETVDSVAAIPPPPTGRH